MYNHQVGGGGLISGVSSYIKQLSPNTKVIGVEPEGKKGMSDSIKLKASRNVSVNTIADSLSAPLHLEYSYNVAKLVIDEMVTVTDDEMKEFMIYAFDNLKLMLKQDVLLGWRQLNIRLMKN